MARWLVGTSGHAYRDWRARFYPSQARLGRRAACGFALPRALPRREWLPYYAARFDTAVELNSPFYRLPRAATFRAGLVQPLDVGEEAACLDGEDELRRDGGRPGPER